MIGSDRNLQAAGRMLGALHCNDKQHLLLKENLATYLAQMPAEFSDRLDCSSPGDLVFSLRRGYAISHRWTEKLIRDVEKPYNDSQVLEHVQRMQEELGRQTDEILQSNPYPGKLYVVGSLARGRLGANSDLDLVAEARKLPQDHEHVHISDLSVHLSAFGTHIETTPEEAGQPGYLEGIYREVMASKGYDIRAGRVTQTALVPHEVEPVPREAGFIVWSFSDLPV